MTKFKTKQQEKTPIKEYSDRVKPEIFRPEPLLLTVHEAAQILNLGVNRTYALTKTEPQLPHIKIGSTIRIPKAALVLWIEKQTNQ